MNKANYQSGDITKNNLQLWNDFTVKHEIVLCSEVLLGIPKYNMKGSLENHGRDGSIVWLRRMSNAISEARDRFGYDEEYIKELDDLEFLIDYELV